MTKYFLALITLLFCLPMIVSADFNDVQFPQDTTLTLGALNFTVTAGSQVAYLIVDVGTGSFRIGLENGSSITIISLDRQDLSNTAGYQTVCGPTVSSLTINYTGALPQMVSAKPMGSCDQNIVITGGTGGGGGASTPTTTTGAITINAASGGTATATTAENTKATVEVPAGAITANTTINVAPTVKTDAAVATAITSTPSGLSVVGGFVYNLTATSGGASVASFNKTLTLTFTYTDAQVAGLNEANLTVYRWTGTQWAALPSTVSTVTNTIKATTTQFSYFAVMGGTTLPSPSAGYTGIPTGFTFAKNLKSGMKDNDVVYLKTVLAAEGCVSGLSNTNYFASKTLAGAKCFCKKYKSDISKAAGYTVSCSGLVGAGMRTKLNALLAGISSEQE
jgi:hypothetical protein